MIPKTTKFGNGHSDLGPAICVVCDVEATSSGIAGIMLDAATPVLGFYASQPYDRFAFGDSLV